MITDTSLFRAAHKDDFEGGVIVDDHAVTGVLYPTFDDKRIERKRKGATVVQIRPADIRPYTHEHKQVVDPGGGTSLFDREYVFGSKDWWSFRIPKGTIVPDSLQIVKGHFVERFNATHYQIEPAAARMEVVAFKGALDNLARNAVVKLYEDARK